jgi:hypothetical protein
MLGWQLSELAWLACLMPCKWRRSQPRRRIFYGGFVNALPESGALLSAFCRALGKEVFTECRTRQIPALGNDRVYRE